MRLYLRAIWIHRLVRLDGKHQAKQNENNDSHFEYEMYFK